MDEARKLYEAGRLTDAVSAMTDEVKKHPTDQERRGFLAELLCISGNVDRADAQLSTVTAQQPKVAVGLNLVRQLIRAEGHRRDFFERGRVVDVLQEPSDAMRLLMEASLRLREGEASAASDLLVQAEELRKPLPGSHAGQAFEDFRDLDDRIGGHFEVLTSTGKYFWIPMERVVSFVPRKPERPLDLCWLPVEMSVEGGPDGLVYLPSVYTAHTPVTEDEVLLGRVTEWIEIEGGAMQGKGQRSFLVGEDDKSLLELGELEFEVEAVS